MAIPTVSVSPRHAAAMLTFNTLTSTSPEPIAPAAKTNASNVRRSSIYEHP